MNLLNDLRVMGRATQGVKLINLKNNDSIAAVAKVMKEDEEDRDQITSEENPGIDSSNEDGTTIDNSQNDNNN